MLYLKFLTINYGYQLKHFLPSPKAKRLTCIFNCISSLAMNKKYFSSPKEKKKGLFDI